MSEGKSASQLAREEMERQNLSARKLARRAKVNKETVLDFIHERRKTHPYIVDLLCRELGLDTTKAHAQAKKAGAA